MIIYYCVYSRCKKLRSLHSLAPQLQRQRQPQHFNNLLMKIWATTLIPFCFYHQKGNLMLRHPKVNSQGGWGRGKRCSRCHVGDNAGLMIVHAVNAICHYQPSMQAGTCETFSKHIANHFLTNKLITTETTQTTTGRSTRI